MIEMFIYPQRYVGMGLEPKDVKKMTTGNENLKIVHVKAHIEPEYVWRCPVCKMPHAMYCTSMPDNMIVPCDGCGQMMEVQ